MARQIRIPVSGTKKMMVIDIDDAGQVSKVSDEGGKKVVPQPVGNSKLDGKTIISVSDHAIIETHSSPGCVYYFFNGQYYRICS